MKITLLLIFFSFSCYCSKAQIAIGRYNFPDDGDTLYEFAIGFPYVSYDSYGMYGSAGPDVIWDFSDIIIPEEYYIFSYSVFQDSFLTAVRYMLYGSNESWTYIASENKIETKNYGHHYFDGSITSNSYSTYYGGRTVLKFPLMYNSLFSDTAYYKVTSSFSSHAGYWNDTMYWTAIDTNICDGWGTIKLPFGTFPALRVHSIHNTADSLGNVSQSNNIVEYAWYTHFEKGPILRTFHQNGSLNWVWYLYSRNVNPMDVPAVVVDSSKSILCYQGSKPWTFQLEIKNVITSTFHMMICDVQGKIILDKNMSMSSPIEKFPIDLASCSDGIYFLKIQEDDFVKTFKLYKGH